MALDGPYSLDDLVRMTSGGAKRKAAVPRAAAGDRPLRLLGIDPGTRFVGWGVIDYDPQLRTLTLVDSGCIAPGEKRPVQERLRDIFEELERIIARTKPTHAALEETFAGVNMKSALAMGQGRGIALLSLARANLDVLEISPRSIKQSVTGSGAADKDRVAQMVLSRLNLKGVKLRSDVTDALAAAIALAQRI
jgi:crossover junction endodeoxyribonuclease RuvC